MDKIVDERKRSKKTLYHICWQGEGPEGDLWLPANKLKDCEALDLWLNKNITGCILYIHSSDPASSFSLQSFLKFLANCCFWHIKIQQINLIQEI